MTRTIHSIKNSSFLTRADVAPPVSATVSVVREEKMSGNGEMKNVVYFKDQDKGLVLNWTNAQESTIKYQSG